MSEKQCKFLTSCIVTWGSGSSGVVISSLWAKIFCVASWGTWQQFNLKNGEWKSPQKIESKQKITVLFAAPLLVECREGVAAAEWWSPVCGLRYTASGVGVRDSTLIRKHGEWKSHEIKKSSTITHSSFRSTALCTVTQGSGGGDRAISPPWAEIFCVTSWGTCQHFNWKKCWVKITVKNWN